MKKEISEETRSRMQAAVEANRKRREDSTMVFGEWRIFRADEDNFVLQKNENDSTNLYYGVAHFEEALKRLLREQISAKHKNGINGIISAIQRAETAVLAGFQKSR